MTDLRQNLAIARAFAHAAQSAPLWAKEKALTQLVASMLDCMAAMVLELERLEGKNDGETQRG